MVYVYDKLSRTALQNRQKLSMDMSSSTDPPVVPAYSVQFDSAYTQRHAEP